MLLCRVVHTEITAYLFNCNCSTRHAAICHFLKQTAELQCNNSIETLDAALLPHTCLPVGLVGPAPEALHAAATLQPAMKGMAVHRLFTSAAALVTGYLKFVQLARLGVVTQASGRGMLLLFMGILFPICMSPMPICPLTAAIPQTKRAIASFMFE